MRFVEFNVHDVLLFRLNVRYLLKRVLTIVWCFVAIRCHLRLAYEVLSRQIQFYVRVFHVCRDIILGMIELGIYCLGKLLDMGRRAVIDRNHVRQEILDRSKKIFADGDMVQRSVLEEQVSDIDFLMLGLETGWKIRNEFLYAAISAAYAFFASPHRPKGQISQFIALQETRPLRRDSNPANSYVKIVFQEWDRRSWHRFAKVLMVAKERKMSPQELYEELLRIGGVEGFLKKCAN